MRLVFGFTQLDFMFKLCGSFGEKVKQDFHENCGFSSAYFGRVISHDTRL